MRAPVHAAHALRLAALVAAGALTAPAIAPAAGAQAIAAPALLATRPEPVTADAGSAFTASIRLTNASRDTLLVTPRVLLPEQWYTVLGASPFTLAPGEGDTWLVSVRIPARATAGRYRVGLSALNARRDTLLRDSVLVEIKPRRAVALSLAERPAYAVSGRAYRGAFLVHNRGNVPTTFTLRATSALGTIIDAPARLALAPDESRLVQVQVSATLHGQGASDDLVQLTATGQDDTTPASTASMRMTVVQRAGTVSPLHTVASTLRLRAAGGGAGVSPFELAGSGRLRDGGPEQLEYVLRGGAAAGSPFGDHEEYRVALRGGRYLTQIGDALYFASPLTSTGVRGFGGGVDLGDSTTGGGVFAQRFRFAASPGSERGAFVRAGALGWPAAPRFGANVVQREGGEFAGRVLSGTSRLHPAHGLEVDLELADSRGAAGRGGAWSARVRGGSFVRFDAGRVEADRSFAGPGRGTRSQFGSVSTASWNDLQLLASTGSHEALADGLVDAASGGLAQYQRSSNVELSYDSRITLGYGALERQARSRFARERQSQRGLFTRVDLPAGLGRVWGTAGAGLAHDGAAAPAHRYGQLALGGSLPIGTHSLSLYADASDGATVLRGANRVLTVGADARLQLAVRTTATLSATDTRMDGPGGYARLDAILTQALANGSRVSMRARLGGRGVADAFAARKQAYVEYSMPLALPVGPSRAVGRVRGRVVDQQTGRGVANALVRLGPQAALTDEHGRVAFAGLPSGAYRLTLAQQLASGSTVFTGDANVAVHSGRRTPATFNVAIEPPSTVTGTIRRLVVARTGLGTTPDSLADGGPLEGVTVALAGVRDTVYRVTDAAGLFAFTDVPAGSWTAIVLSEAAGQTQWEADRIPLVVRAGAKSAVAFKLVPRRRRVRIVSGDGIGEVRERQ